MKKLKKAKFHTICQLSNREQIDRCISSPFVAVLHDEMEYGSDLREVDWYADTVEELTEWCSSY